MLANIKKYCWKTVFNKSLLRQLNLLSVKIIDSEEIVNIYENFKYSEIILGKQAWLGCGTNSTY